MKNIKDFIKLVILLIIFFNIGSIIDGVFSLIGVDLNLLSIKDVSYIEGLCESVLIIIVVLLYKKELSLAFADFKENFNVNEFFKLTAIFLGIKIGSAFLTVIISMIINVNITTSENQSLIDLFTSTSPLIMLITTSYLAPVVEEGIFRLGIRKVIKNDNLFILISGLIFGLMHIFPTTLVLAEALTYGITYVAMGWVLSWIYVKTDNIWYSITIHALNNLLSMLILL